jgi:hypothetical protein
MNSLKRAVLSLCATALTGPLFFAAPASAATKSMVLQSTRNQFVNASFTSRNGCIVRELEFTATKLDYKLGRGGVVHDSTSGVLLIEEDICRNVARLVSGTFDFDLKMRSNRWATLTGTARLGTVDDPDDLSTYKVRLEFSRSEPFTQWKTHENVIGPEGHVLILTRGMSAGATVRGSVFGASAPSTNLIASLTGAGEMARSHDVSLVQLRT